MSDIQVHAPDVLPPGALHAAFTEAFADYLAGPFALAAAQWPGFLRRQGVDLAQSRVALRAETILAFALVAPRPELRSWRLATMGAVPAARGTGAAAALLDDFARRAGGAAIERIELECFAQNERALRLYRSRGFEVVHELRGYVRAAGSPPLPGDGAAGEEVSIESAFDWLDTASRDIGELPFQVTAAALREHAAGALKARRTARAQLVFAGSGGDAITVHSLVDRDPTQAGAAALVGALVRDYPSHRIAVPQLQRPDLGGNALDRLRFSRQPLFQFFMRKRL
jgi:ribosomal protein S18 acetylase RimI-like enzyme